MPRKNMRVGVIGQAINTRLLLLGALNHGLAPSFPEVPESLKKDEEFKEFKGLKTSWKDDQPFYLKIKR